MPQTMFAAEGSRCEIRAASAGYFVFDQGQGLSEHTAPFDALVQILKGEAEITLGGTPHQLHGG